MNSWAIKKEGSFYANVEGDFAHCECGVCGCAISSANNQAFENLNTFLLAFDDLCVNFYSITDAELRDVFFDGGLNFAVYFIDDSD